MFRLFKLMAFMVALAGMLVLASPAQADFMLTFTGDGASVTIDWNTASVTSSSGTTNAGLASVSGGPTITQGFAGSPYTEELTVSNLYLGSTTTTGALIINTTADNSATPGPPAQIGGLISVANNTGSSQSFTFSEQSALFGSPSAPPPATVTSLADAIATGGTMSGTYVTQINGSTVPGTTVTLTTIATSSSGTITPLTPPFTLGGLVSLSLGTGADVTDLSFQSNVTPTPVPDSIILLGSGVGSLLGFSWMRRKRTVIAA